MRGGARPMARKSKRNPVRARTEPSSRSKISCAIATILGTASAAHCVAARAADVAVSATSDRIEEVIVTAQRRTENVQNVPIAIQALTSETLEHLNVSTLDDFIRYLPNVTAPTSGPGQSQVFMRGLSVGSDGVQSGGSISGFPNVAIYLDDQSGRLPSRNLDVYTTDLERVEVLEGPQGTLFGAGAQAGVVRYITNKPKLNRIEGSITTGIESTSGGDPSYDVSAMINVPIVDNVLAVRAVLYDDHHGGFINNVPATFTRKATDLGIHYAYFATACDNGSAPANGTCTTGNPSAFGPPPNATPVNNYAIAKKAINPVTYSGFRGSGLWQVNDDWN